MSDDAERQLQQALKNLDRNRTRGDLLRLARLNDEAQADEVSPHDAVWEKRVEALLNEYNSLRSESMNSTNNRVQILMLGGTAVAAVSGGSFALAASEHEKIASLAQPVISWAVPALCVLVLLVWISEARRASRAGYYLAAEIEPRLNELLGRYVMRWEGSLWAGFQVRDERFGPSMMAVAIFGGIAFLAPFLGFLLSHPVQTWATLSGEAKSNFLINVGIPLGIMLFFFIYCALSLRHLVNRNVLQTVFRPDGR